MTSHLSSKYSYISTGFHFRIITSFEKQQNDIVIIHNLLDIGQRPVTYHLGLPIPVQCCGSTTKDTICHGFIYIFVPCSNHLSIVMIPPEEDITKYHCVIFPKLAMLSLLYILRPMHGVTGTQNMILKSLLLVCRIFKNSS